MFDVWWNCRWILAFSCLSVSKLMKALFTQGSKGPPEFICELYWCFPCPLKGDQWGSGPGSRPPACRWASSQLPPPAVSHWTGQSGRVTGGEGAFGPSGSDGQFTCQQILWESSTSWRQTKCFWCSGARKGKTRIQPVHWHWWIQIHPWPSCLTRTLNFSNITVCSLHIIFEMKQNVWLLIHF